MYISFDLSDINYVGISGKIYPLIMEKAEQYRDKNIALNMLMSSGVSVKGMLGRVLGFLPQDVKNEILTEYINKNRDTIADALNSAALDRGYIVNVSDITALRFGSVIEFDARLDNIGYASLAKRAFPLALEKLRGYDGDNIIIRTLSRVENVPDDLIGQLAELIPQESKDELAVYFINEHRDKISEIINGFFEENSVEVTVSDIKVSINNEEEE